MEEVKHYQVNQRYRFVLEQAASTKGTLGIKCEANGDDLDIALNEVKIAFTNLAAFALSNAPKIEGVVK